MSDTGATGHAWPCTRFYVTASDRDRCTCPVSDTGAVGRAARAWTRITGLPLGAEGSPTPDTIRAALAAPTVEQVAAREAVQRLIDQAVEVAADDTPLLTTVQDARAAVAALWGAR